MSFSATIPRAENAEDFEREVYNAKVTPKPDGRTKVGKRQNELADAAKATLSELAYGLTFDSPMSGTISGHVNNDLTGNVYLALSLLGPLPSE